LPDDGQFAVTFVVILCLPSWWWPLQKTCSTDVWTHTSFAGFPLAHDRRMCSENHHSWTPILPCYPALLLYWDGHIHARRSEWDTTHQTLRRAATKISVPI